MYLYKPDFKEKNQAYCNIRYFLKQKTVPGVAGMFTSIPFYLVNISFQNIQRESEFCVIRYNYIILAHTLTFL